MERNIQSLWTSFGYKQSMANFSIPMVIAIEVEFDWTNGLIWCKYYEIQARGLQKLKTVLTLKEANLWNLKFVSFLSFII